MLDNILIFEDELTNNFYPLALTRPVFDLRSGMNTILEKIVRLFKGAHFSFYCRSYLKPYLLAKYPNVPVNALNTGGGVLLVNGRLIAGDKPFPFFPDGEDRDFVLTCGKSIVFAYLRNENLNLIKPLLLDEFNSIEIMKVLQRSASFREIEAVLVEFPWDFIKYNQEQLCLDFRLAKAAGIIKGTVDQHAYLYDEGNVFVGCGSEVMAGCVLDARKGPIYIGENVLVKSGSYIEGPTFLGDNSIVSRGYLRVGSNIGKFCRVGGEVEETIFYEYSNKYHEGFIGHSYVGAWVNLGALTTTSDLKNNYSNVKIKVQDKNIDTGMKFLGSIIGDHTKFGIGSLLSTGSIIGAGCNLYGGGMFPRFVPDFVWGSEPSYQEYNLSKFLSTADAVMKRRNVNLSLHENAMLNYIYESTSEARKAFL